MNKLIVTAALLSTSFTVLAPSLVLAQDGGTPPKAPPPSDHPSAPPAAPTAPAAPDDQGAPAQGMPDFQLPPGPVMLSTGWTAADLTPDAVTKASAMLDAVVAKYKGAPLLEDTLKLTSKSALGEQAETLEIAFGEKSDMRLQSGGMKLTSAADSLFLEIDGNTKKYLKVPVTGELQSTIEEVMPGFRLPMPYNELRSGVSGEKLVDAFSLGVLEKLAVVGFRTNEGKDQILMKASNGDMVVTVDPATTLINGVESVFSPPGAPPGMTVGIDMALAPKLPAALTTPIAAPEANGRTAVATIAELMAPVSIGDAAVDFTLPDSAGNTVALADLKGSVVILDFWATWCGPCQRGLPKLDEFAKWAAESGKPIKVFGVDTWERVEKDQKLTFAKEFWATKGFSFPTLIDVDDKVIGGYGFQGIPATIVIGVDGTVVAVHEGFDPEMVQALKTDVEKALAKAPAAP